MPNTIPPSDALSQFMQRHDRLLVLTGAGMSTASGIPDYRDRDGVRRGRAPIQGPEFRSSEAVRRRYWARSMIGWPVLSKARPNAGHRSVAMLEARGRLAGLVTQNVDGLHQSAGSRGVVELHGSIHRVRCLACEARFERAAIQAALEALNPFMADVTAVAAPDGDAHLEPDFPDTFRILACARCGGVLMPDVVFFGDGVPRACAEQAETGLQSANGVLVIGSSLMVLSSFRLCRMAAEAGKPIAAINLGKTRADHLLSCKLDAEAEQVLPALVDLLD
ncbi:NAD-dependent protein deacetylase [Noviherbaspirillum sp. CPCC 100848]|uniref:protein acetyllysine N-acetyltransferase n=1 Tax=Noviherbaspirillum album TaxID=3080276 RepID=A0ABU6J2G1_9BURK|nr:NAD-dependent protein deacetylase [Noviherbaspirillum sp. CPCC 100848]MEC4717797.1 NAD-dependent protein deacetylase [Noviherbaspirillum sp. CPCC 100848]